MPKSFRALPLLVVLRTAVIFFESHPRQSAGLITQSAYRSRPILLLAMVNPVPELMAPARMLDGSLPWLEVNIFTATLIAKRLSKFWSCEHHFFEITSVLQLIRFVLSSGQCPQDQAVLRPTAAFLVSHLWSQIFCRSFPAATRFFTVRTPDTYPSRSQEAEILTANTAHSTDTRAGSGRLLLAFHAPK